MQASLAKPKSASCILREPAYHYCLLGVSRLFGRRGRKRCGGNDRRERYSSRPHHFRPPPFGYETSRRPSKSNGCGGRSYHYFFTLIIYGCTGTFFSGSRVTLT